MVILSTLAAGPAGTISRRWYQRDPNAWVRALTVARAHGPGVTLLDAIDARYRAQRDDVAREAFDRRLTVAEVAKERRGNLCTPRTPTAMGPRAPVYWK